MSEKVNHIKSILLNTQLTSIIYHLFVNLFKSKVEVYDNFNYLEIRIEFRNNMITKPQ